MSTFEEYKFVVESTEKISNRRLSMTQLFFSIDTALLAAIAFVVTKVDTKNLGAGGYYINVIIIWTTPVSHMISNCFKLQTVDRMAL